MRTIPLPTGFLFRRSLMHMLLEVGSTNEDEVFMATCAAMVQLQKVKAEQCSAVESQGCAAFVNFQNFNFLNSSAFGGSPGCP